MSFRTKLGSDRASIILETALCLPLYFVLLIFLVDVPQIMAHRQSLLGLARLHADVKARNFGFAPMLKEDFCKRLFWDNPGRVQSIELMGAHKEDTFDKGTESKLAGWGKNKSFFSSDNSSDLLNMVKSLIGDCLDGILTGGSVNNFFDEIFATDVFYRSCPRIAVTTVLPPEFYAVVMNLEVDKNLYIDCPYDCWQPSGNSAQEAKQTVFAKIGKIINNFIRWLKVILGLDGLNVDF
ncbi:MAG: pilus assembly protein [Lentisphaerae bacterium]|jgi:hypothetical protein|nr:pilus assembly protein [Lentisphaerota bacterium]